MADFDRFSHHGAQCPYCEHMNLASDSDGYMYDEELENWECGDCGETFLISAHCSWSWITAREERDYD